MTRQEIENMSAGREMDALIAEKVMGWKSSGVWWIDSDENIKALRYWDSGSYTEPFKPSTDISAAWQVLEKMRVDCNGGGEPDYITLICYKELEPTWYCAKTWAHHDGDIPEFEVTAETAPLAISRAALLAVMNL